MILAGITLYNPNAELLERNLLAISGQVDGVALVDNGSQNLDDVKAMLRSRFPEARLMENGDNLGVAAALNRIFAYARDHGYDWALTLDQDSVCPDGMIAAFREHMDAPKIGCLCLMVYDRVSGEKECAPQGDIEEVRRCITSGAMSPVSAWAEVGGFCDEMFIDCVDFDFCAKLIEHGYRILRLNGVLLDHAVGDAARHRLLWKKFCTLNHPASRKYYQIRNGIYYSRAHRGVVSAKKEAWRLIVLFGTTLLYEKDKRRKLNAMLAGARDGFQMARAYDARQAAARGGQE